MILSIINAKFYYLINPGNANVRRRYSIKVIEKCQYKKKSQIESPQDEHRQVENIAMN